MKLSKYLLTLFFLFYFSYSFSQKKFKQTGKASYYASKFHGRQTANGERFNMHDLTAAHKTLPFNTKVRVTNLKNNKSVVVRINDRGPYAKGRIIDLSKAAAKKIDMIADGVATVKVEEVGKGKSNSGNRTNHRLPSKQVAQGKYYNYNLKEISPNGFGVQIASYSKKNLAKQKAKEYQAKYEKQVIIQVSNKGLYRLILGKFSSKTKAEKLKKQLKRKFKGCFVIEY